MRAVRTKSHRQSLIAAASMIAVSSVVIVPAYASAGSLRGRLSAPELTAPACQLEEEGCFTLLGVTILGAVTISPKELSFSYSDQLAKPARMQELVAIAERITQAYRDRGYFLSQAVVLGDVTESGIATIRVFEGRISDVQVIGDRPDLAEPIMQGVADAPIADLPDIDRRLARIRAIRGLSVKSRIRPDPEDPARHELVLTTRFDPIEGYAGLSNRGSDRSGPLQAYAGIAFNSVLTDRDQIKLNLFTTPADLDEYTRVSAIYRYTFLEGDTLLLGASASQARDGYNPASSEIGGESLGVWLKYERPLVLSRKRRLYASAEFDAKHKEHEWTSGGGYRDELRVARVALRGLQSDDGVKTYVFVEVSSGLDILGASGPSVEARSRYNADATFTKVYARASHYRDIGKYFGLYGWVAGQAADGPLLSSEEFSVGGPLVGRGYGYGEISGDHGIAGLVELRAGFAPDHDLINFAQAYLSYDAAMVWNDTPYGQRTADLESAAIGLRLNVLDRLSAGLEFAKPLTLTPYDEDDKDWRQYFQVSVTY